MGTPEALTSQVEEVLRAWVYPERKRLTQLLNAGPLTPLSVARALERLTEAAATTLRVDRASIWRIAPGGQQLECLGLFEQAKQVHSKGQVITQEMAPAYFRALASEQVIVAHDARVDPRTMEFEKGYLTPLGITSLLDAPVFVSGRAVAVVCHEHVGPARRWQAWEELVAGTFAEFVGMVLGARAEPALLQGGQLRSEEENLRALIDASPVPLVVTRASDHKVIFGNRRALGLFEVPEYQMPGMDAGLFWVSQGDRATFLETLLGQGRIDGLEVRLRTATGREFWARMSAEALRFKGEVALLASMVDISAEKQAEENLRNVFALAPVALVASRLKDQVLLEGNQYAAQMFEIEVDAARGRLAPDFWVRPEDRDELRAQVKAHGKVTGFEAELKTSSGRHFWASLSAGVATLDGSPALLVGGIDVTKERAAREALEKSEDTLRTLLDAAPLPLVVTGLDDGVVRYANSRASVMFELPLTQFVGKKAPSFYAKPSDRDAFVEGLRKSGQVDAASVQLQTSTGRPFWALLSAKTLELNGEKVFVVGFTEVTAQKELEQRLWTMATIDGLTGVFNRRHFFELAEAEVTRAGRHGRATSVAMLDLDHFKKINDEHGHSTGDLALKAAAGALKAAVRETDLVARYGGEEFAVLFPDCPLDGARAIMERVREVVEGLRLRDGEKVLPVKLTISIGVAQLEPKESLHSLLKRADQVLYAAKHSGRNRVVVDPVKTWRPPRASPRA
ncbi:MAG: diguanylate cyclase [Myxococcaceae bacterium]|nr:diguanylate cyclase [Myxococcaceae bacterium]